MSMHPQRPEVHRELNVAPRRRRRNRSALACMLCDGKLSWHQPDHAKPDRLLGVCPRCGGWHIMDGDGGPGHVALSLIPGTARRCDVRRAPRPAGAPAEATPPDASRDTPRWRRARSPAHDLPAIGHAVAGASG